MFSVCWHCSFLSSPWCFQSSHSWCPFPPLCFSILFLSISLLLFHLSLLPPRPPLSLLFEKIDIQMKSQSNVTSHLVGFRQILSASSEEGAQVGGRGCGQWRARLLKRMVLDKIKGGGGLFRVTKAVGTRVWGFSQGNRDEQRVSYLTGPGDCCLPVWELS